MRFTDWKVSVPSDAEALDISRKFNISKLCAKLIVSRGISDVESFLNCDVNELHDPFLLPDMEKATLRILRAIDEQEKICVYGDYDVDGITSTYILSDYLTSIGADCEYYIPDRFGEGYGVNSEAVNKLCDKGVSLIVTVDTGVTAYDEVESAKVRGCDFVITDHHECRETLPNACAVVNPHRADSEYPFQTIAGVGVAFKLICALERKVAYKYLPYVCIGTIADVMPIVDENRAIVKRGLEMLTESDNPALCSLIEKAGLSDKKITADSIGFGIAPRMNAAGRMESAKSVVALLNEQDKDKAEIATQALCDLNRKRQDEERKIYDEALAMLEGFDEKKNSAIVLAGEGWHHGVIGIVASRLAGKFDVPVILLTKEENQAKGSGRSVFGFNLYEALSGASDILEQYGGHEMAVGLTVSCDNIEALSEHISDSASSALSSVSKELCADFEVNPNELTVSEIESLSLLEPFGEGNSAPMLVMRDVNVLKITPIGNGRHLKMQFSKDGVVLDAIYFGNTLDDISVSEGDIADVMFRPEVNDFRGKALQLVIGDIRPTENKVSILKEGYFSYRRVLEKRASTDEYINAQPSYNELGSIWRSIKKLGKIQVIKMAEALSIPYEKIFVALDVFEELGLIKFKATPFKFEVEILPVEGKANLEESKILRDIALSGLIV